jgi:hypothetical protein
MVVLDIVSANIGGMPANALNVPSMRLLLLDMQSQSAVTLAALPLVDTTSTFGMAAADDGTFIIVKQPAGVPLWVARRFTVNQQQAMACLGFIVGTGTVVDNPIRTTNGIVLPAVDVGVQRFAALSPGMSFNGGADDSLGCSTH